MWLEELKLKKVALALNIRAIRLESGLSKEKLALDAGVDRALVSKIERQISNPTLEFLVKLSLTLKTPIIALLKDPNT